MSDSPGDFTLGGMTVTGQTRVIRRFENANKALHERLLGIINSEVEQIAALARARMGELFRNPGKMQSSVSTQVSESASYIEGTVSASGLPYLAIQEFGGVTRPHDIFPVNAQALHFMTPAAAVFRSGSASATDEVFSQVVHHPGSDLPERSYLRYALAQRRSAIFDAFAQAASDSLGDG